MSALPPGLSAALARRLGGQVERIEPMTGGMINSCAAVSTSRHKLFVKWNPSAPPGFFRAEADGLERIRQTGAIRVPEVIASWDCNEEPEGDRELSVPYLLLEYVPPHASAGGGHALGRALATLHEAETPGQRFGLDQGNYIGYLAQPNGWADSWIEFYRARRLEPQMQLAKRRLSAEQQRLVEKVMSRLERLLAGCHATPSLLHGDLWSGNCFHASSGGPVLVDPAVYYGHREVELAMMDLFGGFDREVIVAYDDAFPIDPGYDRRRPVYQLYPLLVHVNHFGGPYPAATERACHDCLK